MLTFPPEPPSAVIRSPVPANWPLVSGQAWRVSVIEPGPLCITRGMAAASAALAPNTADADKMEANRVS